ncbi:MAG: hypothetical protein ACNS62_00545 [Candidatus Cyclobacteriaceae bacterium M3_2C_046]
METAARTKPIVTEYIKEFARQIEGIFVDYNDYKFAVIVPLIDSKRIQRVFGIIDEKFHRIEFRSMVCKKEQADFSELMEQQKEFIYSKFLKEEENVMISASLEIENAEFDLLRKVIMEVAEYADVWEKKFTGQDIY